MTATKLQPDDAEINRLASHGAQLLRNFHEQREKDPISKETEFRRGHLAGYRHLLDLIYGPRITARIIEAARKETNLSFPHAGMLAEDGGSYYGLDPEAEI